MASSSSHRDDGSDWDSAEEMEAESAETLCLFCSKLCKSPELVFKHCSEDHDFCISSLVAKLGLDCFSFIKMINYIRSKYVPPLHRHSKLLKTDPKRFMVNQVVSPGDV
ncbi:unnamed protein product [Ixodes pacificus]